MAKKPCKRRLKTHVDIRRFLSDTANRLNRAEIDPTSAGRLAYICQVLSKVIEQSDFETRLTDLERKYDEKSNRSENQQIRVLR